MKREIFFIIAFAIQINCLELNDSCVIRDKLGVCKKLRECPSAQYDFNYHGIDFTRCGGYVGDHLIVCCSMEQTTTQKPRIDHELEKLSMSERKCVEYSRNVYQESFINTLSVGGVNMLNRKDTCFNTAVELIIDGTAAKPREFPHMAVLGIKANSAYKWICGGSLISDRFVLTAAHCIIDELNIVRLGDSNLLKTTDDQYAGNFEISENIVHPGYNRASHYNDIALIKLNRLIQFNENVRPLCLPVNSDPIRNKLIATGWGRTSYFSKNSNKLLKVQLDYFTAEECGPVFKNQASLSQGIVNTQLCYGSRVDSKDTCNGDSGGPIQLPHDNLHCMYKIYGITSLGLSCGNQNIPAIYTNVVPYVQWIEGIVWADG